MIMDAAKNTGVATFGMIAQGLSGAFLAGYSGHFLGSVMMAYIDDTPFVAEEQVIQAGKIGTINMLSAGGAALTTKVFNLVDKTSTVSRFTYGALASAVALGFEAICDLFATIDFFPD